MRAKRVAMWALVATTLAWALIPAAASAVHAPQIAAPTAAASHAVATGQLDNPGCGDEHGPHGNGEDDNNGVGHDSDHDHDCTEE